MLQNTLKVKLTEIEELSAKISNLENELEKSEFKRENEKQTCKQTITSLTQSLNDVTRKLQERIDKCINESENRENSLKIFYSSLLQQKENEYKKNILAVEDRLQKEICMMMINSSINRRCKSGQKLGPLCRIIKTESTSFKISNKKPTKCKKKTEHGKEIVSARTSKRMQVLMDENVSLRNRIIKLESQYTAEKCFLQTEAESVKVVNTTLSKELEVLNTQCANQEKEIDKLKFENGILKTEICLNSEKVQNLMKQNKDIVLENATIKQQLQDVSKEYKNLMVSNEQLAHQKHVLELECEEINAALTECKENLFNKLPSTKYDQLMKQNIVLKDLVKQMKSEKKQHDNYATEERIKKLEEMVGLLKKRAYGDS